ncbi:hypothetical protein [Streptomyces californicus]|uniref:hypothetical protein n=1 Tax=Streptomyces californicus TaxID=67351 RepID=UPI00378C0AED
MSRIPFDQLPADVRQAVSDKTGPVHLAVTMTGGMNSGVASVLETESGSVFVKGIASDHAQVAAQRREAEIAPTCPRPVPACTGTWKSVDGAFSDTRSSAVATPTTAPAPPTWCS